MPNDGPDQGSGQRCFEGLPDQKPPSNGWRVDRSMSGRAFSWDVALESGHMQFRHLRYFVKIVEAGSFSRAAATIHVAQPALSQQIAELEEKLGIILLQRSARGVRPTAAGEILYREASEILRRLEQLPGIVRSHGGEIEGAVSIAMASTIARSMAGPFVETCKAALPKVTLKFSDFDSELIRGLVESHAHDLALLFEDELASGVSRKPLFRQQLYLITRDPLPGSPKFVSLEQLSRIPLVLPSLPNGRRNLIDRAFAAAGLSANVVAESGGSISSEISAVRSGIGSAILPVHDLEGLARAGLLSPVAIKPQFHLTCSVISSSDFPLTHAGEAVCNVLVQFVKDLVDAGAARGAEWIG
jgi:LysR family nitrogen assimilation transcriptional regulator